MYSIVITSNSTNKVYNDIQSNSKAYKIIIDTYRIFKCTNNDTFNIVLHDGHGIVIRLTSSHFISKHTQQARNIIEEWRAYA